MSAPVKESTPPPGASNPQPALRHTAAAAAATLSSSPNQQEKGQAHAHAQTSAPSPPNGERRTSFNFLRRQKSTETSKMLKKKRSASGHSQQQQNIPAVPPQLPTHSPLSKIPGFGGENAKNARPDSYQIMSNSTPQRGGSGVYNAAGMYHNHNHSHKHNNSSYYQSSPPPPPPPIPSSSPEVRNGDHAIDPYARTESMTHRGRYSYASSAISSGTGINSPRRVRRRKDPTPFNILVIGEQNSGKTSFIEFLRNALIEKRKREREPTPPQSALPGDSAFTPYYLETDVDSERIGVTLWDSQGLEKKFVDLQLREMSSFLESKFEETFTEEQKVVRAPGVRDTHIHCVFLILDPIRLNANLAAARKMKSTSALSETVRLIGVLDEDLDIQVLRTLQGKTTVIPVISKADTITTTHMALLKKSVWDSLKQAKLDPLEALTVNEESEDEFDERDEDDYLHPGRDESGGEDNHNHDLIDELVNRSSDEDGEVHNSTPPTSPPRPAGTKDAAALRAHRRSISDILSATANDGPPFLPMSIISPDSYEPGIIGRRFPWGFADPYNQEHCDFVRLKDAVFSEWRGELREASREVWYEGWRTSRLRKRDVLPPGTAVAGGTTTKSNGQYQTRKMSTSPEFSRSGFRQGVAF